MGFLDNISSFFKNLTQEKSSEPIQLTQKERDNNQMCLVFDCIVLPIRPIMRTYRLRCRMDGDGQL